MYLESWNYIMKEYNNSNRNTDEELAYHLHQLETLVDKETAVVGIQSDSGCYCGKCGNRVGDNNYWTQIIVNYCILCGQKLEWREK